MSLKPRATILYPPITPQGALAEEGDTKPRLAADTHTSCYEQHGDSTPTHPDSNCRSKQTQADWGAAQICITANKEQGLSKVYLNYTLSTESLNFKQLH